MKKKIILIILFFLTCFLPFNVYADSNISIEYIKEEQKVFNNIPNINSKAVYIAESNTGKVIYEKNAHEKMYPASTTKILTALIAIENCNLTDKAIVSQNAISSIPKEYFVCNLKPGEEHTIETLLYALLLPSANDAANVLAEHISGSIEEFMNICNSRAKQLGCENLNFVNAYGLHDENHYASAYDLYLIAKECKKHEIFNKIVNTKSYTIPATNIYPNNNRTFKNSNEMLFPGGVYYYPYCTGIKTGHTTPAGECFVGSSLYNGLDLISVVLGGKEKNSIGLNDRFYDTKRLYEFTYNNYSIKKIAEYKDIVARINIENATKDTASLEIIVDTDISTILPNDLNKENIKKEVYIKDNIVAPIKENDVLGSITYYADGLIYKTNIIASHDVDKLPFGIYNIIIFVSIFLFIGLCFIILVIVKGHRRGVLLIEIILFVIICMVGFPLIRNDLDNLHTKNIVVNEQRDENKNDY